MVDSLSIGVVGDTLAEITPLLRDIAQIEVEKGGVIKSRDQSRLVVTYPDYSVSFRAISLRTRYRAYSIMGSRHDGLLLQYASDVDTWAKWDDSLKYLVDMTMIRGHIEEDQRIMSVKDYIDNKVIYRRIGD